MREMNNRRLGSCEVQSSEHAHLCQLSFGAGAASETQANETSAALAYACTYSPVYTIVKDAVIFWIVNIAANRQTDPVM